jgi:hypothetical protein
MPRKSSKARLTRSEAREAFLQKVDEIWEEFNTWYDTHPEATFDEIEVQLGKRRRSWLGEMLELTLRHRDLGAMPEPPRCETCGQPMQFKGYPDKAVHGLETDAEIPRAYYVCSTCQSGLFPPGSTAKVTAR